MFEEDCTNALNIFDSICSGTPAVIAVAIFPFTSERSVKKFNKYKNKSSLQVSNDIAKTIMKESGQFSGNAKKC